MLSFTDIKQLSPQLEARRSAVNAIIGNRNEKELDLATKAVKAFISQLQENGSKPTMKGRNSHRTNRKGEESLYFKHQGEKFDSIEAIIPIPLGSLVFTLSFVRSVDYFTEDWDKVAGTGLINAKVTSSLSMKGGDRTEHGRTEGTAPMYLNLSNGLNAAKKAMEGLTETLLGNTAQAIIQELNDELTAFREARKYMILATDEAESNERSAFDEAFEAVVAEITSELRKGINPDDFRAKFLTNSDLLEVDHTGKLRKRSFTYRNCLVRMFSEAAMLEGTICITIDKPKRKNSKHQDVWRMRNNSEGEVATFNTIVEREELEFHTRELAGHIVSCEMLKGLGINLNVE